MRGRGLGETGQNKRKNRLRARIARWCQAAFPRGYRHTARQGGRRHKTARRITAPPVALFVQGSPAPLPTISRTLRSLTWSAAAATATPAAGISTAAGVSTVPRITSALGPCRTALTVALPRPTTASFTTLLNHPVRLTPRRLISTTLGFCHCPCWHIASAHPPRGIARRSAGVSAGLTTSQLVLIAMPWGLGLGWLRFGPASLLFDHQGARCLGSISHPSMVRDLTRLQWRQKLPKLLPDWL
mmetsp:Transcript_58746/g.128750  ORF Transcript_58746/g.128750 Transcript_58746/m.128750 type:complete len:243 (-) Transcript_58746:542-1270(-)